MSEQFLSSWIEARGIAPKDVCVSSKWGYRYTADWKVDTQGEPHEVKEHSISNLLQQTSETEALLGRHLNLYQIHSATFESGVLDNDEVLGQLGTLKMEHGWRIGLTLSGTQQAEVLRKALTVKTPSSDRLFDCVQARDGQTACPTDAELMLFLHQVVPLPPAAPYLPSTQPSFHSATSSVLHES